VAAYLWFVVSHSRQANRAGFECTIGVDDVERTVKAAVAAGGRVLMDRTTIAGVGHLVWLADPSGIVVGAMAYEDDAE